MFDIAFTELMLVSVVALLVIGPKRLPETIRTIMLWLGRIRSAFTSIKTELEQEIGADEIRRQLHNETILKEIKDSKNQISNALKDADQSVQEFKHSVNDAIKQTETAATQSSNDESTATETEKLIQDDRSEQGDTANQTPDSKPAA